MADLFVSTLIQGLIYALVSFGVYITYSILDFPDLGVDGTFPLGAAVTALLLIKGVDPWLTLVISLLVGALAGLFTGVVHVRLKVRDLLAGIIAMGYLSADTTVTGDPIIGLLGALAAVFGWGSEAVLCAWGMRDDAVDNETALQIRETTSALVYLIVVLPIFGAWAFTWNAIPNPGTAVVALAALAGTCSYLFYYKGISVIGAARGMALNISYSAWAVLFGLILLGTVPGPVEIVCCIAILCGTILAACDWGELFGTKKAEA